MVYRDPAQGRAADRERFRKRTAERKAAGLCPRCGVRPPAPDRTVCEECARKRNRAGRARDARLRADGKPRRDPERAKSCEHDRSRRQTAERIVRGVCTKCGAHTPEDGRRLCAGCGEKRRAADRRRYAEASARGELYGGKDPRARRRIGREHSRKRQRDRLAAGRCTRCGNEPAPGDGAVCGSCQEARRVADRERYGRRRAAGLCTTCGRPAFGGESRCGVCAAVESERRDKGRKNERARERYAHRRAANACTDCGGPAHGACRCAECAKRSYERSAHVKGIPVWDPQFIVVELATGAEHGPFDTEAEAVASLVFAKLSPSEVEIVGDAPITARVTGRT